MISVAEAKSKILKLATAKAKETIDLSAAAGRVLATEVRSQRAQPPFPSSSMDGYAVAEAAPGDTLEVIGQAAAGARFDGTLINGQAVRIFTGAVVPEGATRVIIQEDVRRSGTQITLSPNIDSATYIRPLGADFTTDSVFSAPQRITPAGIALLASMNAARIDVYQRPKVAILSTGNELVMPGETPSSDQIIASNAFGLKALFEADGAQTRVLPIARDTISSVTNAMTLANDADILVTIGGASVGDHDLVRKAVDSIGFEQAFYKIAMRPGKPLMAGKLGSQIMVGVPGNPVSSMVCGKIFICPLIAKMQGIACDETRFETARLSRDIGPNGPREHYMRASVHDGRVEIFERQDSALQTVLAQANCLALRPPNAPSAKAGELIKIIHL